MRTIAKVARYQLTQWDHYLLFPCGFLALFFLLELGILALIPVGHHESLVTVGHSLALVRRANGPRPVGGMAALFVPFLVAGLLSMSRLLPFGLSLGLTRRSYYVGTVLLGVSLAAAYGLGLTLLQVAERATGGWGVSMDFFRVPYILNGPWFLTWLTSFVVLMLLFVWGIWFGLIYRRWNITGTWLFVAAQITVLAAAAALLTAGRAWHGFGHFFATLGASGLTGLLAALAVALLVGGLATMRHVTV